MADDIQITVGVTGKKDILDLANAVTTLGKNSEKLAKQLESNRLTDAAYEKGLQQQIAALVKLKVPLESATKFIMGNAAATLKSIEADKASKAAKEALITSQKRADTAFALATQKEKEMAAAEKDLITSRARLDATAKQEAATLDQLKMKYQAGYAEMQLYKAENEQLNLAYKKNILTTAQLKIEQDKLSASFATGTGVFATHANQARSSASRLGVVYQQAGYQAGDFFVQVQSGTSILTAFSQQATQMVGMMYLIPEAGMAANLSLKILGVTASITMAQLTLGLSIAIPVITSLASMFIAMSSATDKANSSAEASVDVFQRLAQATHQLWVERMKLTDPKFDENLVGTQDKLKELTDAYEVASEKTNKLTFAEKFLITTPLAGLIPLIYKYKEYREGAAKAALDDANATSSSYQIEKNLLLISETQKTLDEQAIKAAETQKNQQEEFNRKLETAYSLYARLRGEATILANETARAANALPAFKISQLADQYKQYGQGRVAGEVAVRQANPLYGTPAANNVSVSRGGGGNMGGDTQEQYLAKLNLEYETKKKSVGLTDEQVKRTEFLFTLDEKLSTMKTKRSELEIETEKQRAVAAYDAYAAAEKQAATMDMISSNLNDAFMSMVDGSQTVSGAFRNMMVSILKSVIEQTVTQPAANALSGLFKGIVSGITGSANGNIVGSSGIQAFAKGGVVSSPTMFKHGGGLGVMGEAGPEAIMPLKRGANGKLGVQVSGNNGDNGNSSITINNNINVVGSDAAMVRAEVTKMIPQITEASKVAVIDAKRRGGQMGAAFR